MANKTVMIIEDDVLHMKLFKDILENLGFSTLRARDEKAAMEITRITHPDLIAVQGNSMEDIQALRESGRRAVRVDLGSNLVEAIRRMVDELG